MYYIYICLFAKLCSSFLKVVFLQQKFILTILSKISYVYNLILYLFKVKINIQINCLVDFTKKKVKQLELLIHNLKKILIIEKHVMQQYNEKNISCSNFFDPVNLKYGNSSIFTMYTEPGSIFLRTLLLQIDCKIHISTGHITHIQMLISWVFLFHKEQCA